MTQRDIDAQGAFRTIFDRYVADMVLYGQRLTRDRELVMDCVQNVFVAVYSGRVRIENTADPRAYLYRALRNNILNALGRERHIPMSIDIHLRGGSDETPESRLELAQHDEGVAQLFSRALASLTPRQREVVSMRYVEEMSTEQIATVLGMNYQSVQNLLQRSLKKAREVLTAYQKKGKGSAGLLALHS